MATPPTDPRRTQAKLGRASWAFHGQVSQDVGSQFLPWVSIADLEAMERELSTQRLELHAQIDALRAERTRRRI